MEKYKLRNGEEIPIVMVQRNLNDWNRLEFIDDCPFCGEKHGHGAGSSFELGGGNGTRHPHCFSISIKKSEYYIKEADNERRHIIDEKYKALQALHMGMSGDGKESD